MHDICIISALQHPPPFVVALFFFNSSANSGEMKLREVFFKTKKQN